MYILGLCGSLNVVH